MNIIAVATEGIFINLITQAKLNTEQKYSTNVDLLSWHNLQV